MPRFCYNCGSPLDESQRFCDKCGKENTLSAPAANVQPQQYSQPVAPAIPPASTIPPATPIPAAPLSQNVPPVPPIASQ
ncbi:MAG: zinc ribbon domain-containing protein, partial [Muribaculaceae bacterium]|nr:zinc ribbon domain-containing protein [Muribaculaceae bacterium]